MTREPGLRARIVASIAGILGSLWAPAALAIDGHVGLQIGTHFWPAYSNRDQVEADITPGYSYGLVGGVEIGSGDLPEGSPIRSAITPRLRLRVEIEVSQRRSDLHGVNDDVGQRTADGKTIRATSALFNAWPAWDFNDDVAAYLGGGVGVSWIKTLGSDKTRLTLQGGAGVLIAFPIESLPMNVDLGWRSFFASSAEYRGRLVDLNTHGPIVGIQLEF